MNKLVDLIFLPFELLAKFITNAENIFTKIVRIILLLLLVLCIVFIFVAKPYNYLSRDFKLIKYSTGEEAKSELLRLYPIQTTPLIKYKEVLKKNNFVCKKHNDKKGEYQECTSYVNLMFKKYKWEATLRVKPQDATKISYISFNKKQAKNDFKTLVKKIK